MSFYQIGKGTCRVEKLVDNKSVQLGVMFTGEIFGEISLLEGVRTSASILADEADTEIYVIDGNSLKVSISSIVSSINGRFYSFVSQLCVEDFTNI